jgi:hypothetical protein
MHARLREDRIDLEQETPEDREILPAVALAQCLEEGAGLGGAEPEAHAVSRLHERGRLLGGELLHLGPRSQWDRRTSIRESGALA